MAETTAMNNGDEFERYLVIEEKGGSWSIADRHITDAERAHRMISGLSRAQADDLVAKLNSPPSHNTAGQPSGGDQTY